MKMTDSEKLKICTEFIEDLMNMQVDIKYDTFSLDDVECECDACGERDNISKHWPRSVALNTEYVDVEVVNEIKDRAWHVWASVQ